MVANHDMLGTSAKNWEPEAHTHDYMQRKSCYALNPQISIFPVL